MIETVEKRARRRRRLAAVKGPLQFMEPYEALSYTRNLYACWDGVRRIAGTLIGSGWMKDVAEAWQVLGFVKGLPGGEQLIWDATAYALAVWESEVAEDEEEGDECD